MKNRQNLIYFLIFILTGTMAYLFIRYKDSAGSHRAPDRDFAVANTDEIGKIFLGRKKGGNILLTRNGADWIVNNKYKVFPNTMQYLLETIRDLKIKSIPHRNAYEMIMNSLAAEGIKVEIYDRSDALMKTYYVGGVTADEEGLYCLMNGAKQPYILFLGPAPTNLRVRYDIDEQDWRDRSLCNVKTEDIESVSLSFPYDTGRDYNVDLKNQDFRITDPSGKELFHEKGNRFLNAYRQEFAPISTEAIINDHRAKDSICALKPYAIMTITTGKGPEPVTLKYYPVPNISDEAVQLDRESLEKKDFFRFYICRQDSDFLLIQLPQIKGIFMDRREILDKISNKAM